MNHRDTETQRDELTSRVIGAGIEVHRQLGPGLLESAYEECLCYELNNINLPFQRQVKLPIRYKSIELDAGYRLDLVIENQLVVEVKAIEKLLPIHDAQLLTYLRLGKFRIGLLMNFNTPVLKDGIRRKVL